MPHVDYTNARERGEQTPSRSATSRIGVVVNTRSRSGARAYQQAMDSLRQRGVRPRSAYPLRDPARLPETVNELIREGCDVVVLGGGDGTVSSVVDVLANQRVALGLLPLGTANDFARTLGIPTDLDQACATIADGQVADVDLGLVGSNYYVNATSMGLSVGVHHALSPRLKRWAGWLAYPLATLKALRAHQPFTAWLEFPDGDHDSVRLDRLLQLAVGNGRYYGGGMIVSSDADIDDRALDVYAVATQRRRDMVGTALRIRRGDLAGCPGVHAFRTPRVRIQTDPVVAVNLDGEIEAHTPQDFSVAADALRVLVPRASYAQLSG